MLVLVRFLKFLEYLILQLLFLEFLVEVVSRSLLCAMLVSVILVGRVEGEGLEGAPLLLVTLRVQGVELVRLAY